MSMITIIQSTVVFPAEETPHRSLWLSSLDLISVPPFRHSGTIFIYRPVEDNDFQLSNFFNANILKGALSKVLVPFYPLAGRLKKNEKKGRLEIDCNGKGVLFVEAEMRQSLTELGDFTPSLELKKQLLPSLDYSKGISSFPLLAVQITRFSCGGVAVGFATHHQLTDGVSLVYFVTSWARVVNGLDLIRLPNHDRAPFLAPRCPPQVSFPQLNWEYGPPQGISGDVSKLKVILEKNSAIVSIFKLTKDQVGALKVKARISSKYANHDFNLSTYEVLAGHVWRCACKARGLANDQEVRLFIPINGRPRLKNPTLPDGFYGNVVFYPGCVAKAGEIKSNPLGFAASRIHETMIRANDEEYLRSSIDFFETHPNMESLIRGPHKIMCPNLNINSWAKFPFAEADFGWGQPVFAGHGGIGFEGQSFIIPSINGDGTFSVAISLFSSHMTQFKTLFYHLIDSSI